MKKTTHINLSGMAFKIEEDAYERLRLYLEEIETHLGQDEASETLNDIETRMAELFSSVLLSSDKAITINDVEEVIKTLGKPEDFGSEEEEKPKKKKVEGKKARRLFRDPNNRILGGVCSGLGAYFNTEPIIFRLCFIIGLFYGISILPYIILWIIIPKARTIEQRAQMTSGYSTTSSRRRTSYNPEKQAETKVFKFLKTFLGILIVVGTTLTMFGLTIALLVSNINFGSHNLFGWLREFTGIFLDAASTFYSILGVGLVFGIPIIIIFYLGLHLIFNFKRGGKIVGLTGFFVWLIGVGLIVYSSINTAKQFTERAIVSQTDVLQPFEGDTLYLKHTPFKNSGKKLFRLNNNLRAYARDKRIEKGNRTTVYVNKQLTVEGSPGIYIIKNSEKFAITVERESLGANVIQAEENALNIEYFWLQKENELFLDRIFSLSEGTYIRGQELTVKIETPEGMEIVIDPVINARVRNY